MWDSIISQISIRAYQVHRPALPGHSGFGHVRSSDLSAYADAVMSQIDHQSQDNFLFVGHSMGGYIACELARKNPDRTLALCLFHSTSEADTAEKKLDRARAIELAKQNRDLYIKTMINGLFDPSRKDLLRSKIDMNIENAIANIDINSIIQAQEAMSNRQSSLSFLQGRAFPLYYFLGANDPRLHHEAMRKELQQLPGAVSFFAEGVSHMGHLECPAVAASFIDRILRADC